MERLLFPADPTIDERFAEFDREHPEVYRLFRTFAEQLLASGKTRGSARDIWGAIRWRYAVGSRTDAYRLNNNYTALYARKLATEDERFADFFEFRERKSAG